MREKLRRGLVIVVIEVIALLALLVLATLWMANPSGPYEPYTYGGGVVLAFIELYRRHEGGYIKTEGVNRTPAERVRHHEAMRSLFTRHIAQHKAQNLRKDVILRHVNRPDKYPNGGEGTGISPWFKVGLLATYHMGIKVGLGWTALEKVEGGFRRIDRLDGVQDEVNAMLIGEIPYDSIEAMNPDGDEYYYLPHIFCHFAHDKQPYKRL